MLPTIFIGSSSEARKIAYAIQMNIDSESEPTVWDQGLFELGHSTLESLTQSLESFDFGVLVFSADDVLTLHNKEYAAVRDNVIFELGLFMGHLGTERTFFVIPKTDSSFRLPTDLSGITYATYNPIRSDNNLQAALHPACNQILSKIRKLGPRKPITKGLTESISVTRNREEHYEAAITMIATAKRRILVIERTPVLLFGPRHFWYEKEYYNALKSYAKSTMLYSGRICHCLYVTQDSRIELSSSANPKAVFENLRKWKNHEIQSEGRFQLSSMDVYFGSFMVVDDNCSIWFKGKTSAISINKEDTPTMATILAEIFSRLFGDVPKTCDQLLSELPLQDY